MNFQFLFEKLEASDVYADFIKENPGAYLTSGFFVLDIENKGTAKEVNQYTLDFFSPTKNPEELGKWWSFQFQEEGVKLIPLNKIEDKNVEIPDFIKNPSRLKGDSSINFEEIEKLIELEMKSKGVNKMIQKIIIALQRREGSDEDKKSKDTYLCTVFVSGFGLIKCHIIEDENEEGKGKVTLFENKSFFDFLRKS